jgi:hypothetical protein
MNRAAARAECGAYIGTDPPDLQSQLEALFGAVWGCERWARTEDRIDAAVRYGSVFDLSGESAA